ncbi:MAG TPA: glycoside hydrolase domain-containing protein [Terriglobales bacterium]|nr:glycoside hydrolase domain-containing protein [Terriglobales bacterium]
MKQIASTLVIIAALFVAALRAYPQSSSTSVYLGFDRNDYPGDNNLSFLRQTFSYAGFWLNNPPGEKLNNWAGKRQVIESAGFGFLVLFNGKLDTELKTVPHARSLGKSDAQAAVATARREGFPNDTIIFLDMEEGGRMLPEQKAYIYAWVDGVNASGFKAGVYCSGIPAQDDGGIVTANDIRDNAAGKKIVYWVTNDACPPSPGCAFPKSAPGPAKSGIDYADIWQFAQSPKRNDVAGGCPKNYASDGNCYPPAASTSMHLHVDVNTATSADPSHGRSR